MAGRIKRIRLAFFWQLAADIARREREHEERLSAEEWHRTGIDGVCAELQARLGGSANGLGVVAHPDYVRDIFTIGIRYRGNGVGVDVDKREIRLHRRTVLKHLEAYGAELIRMPCRHVREPKWRMQRFPATFGAMPPAAMKEAYCPDCEAVVSKA
jgi:hypothetical protein